MRALAVFLLLAFLFSKPLLVFAWSDCPFGKVNDPFPGSCARFLDSDNDGICDHSQPAPGERLKTEVQKENNQREQKTGKEYNLGIISFILLLAYGISSWLVKAKKIKLTAHRKIWNVFLALSFLLTALSGILLVLRVSYGIDLKFPLETLFWHVETGIVFILIAVFHFAWHLPYYRNLFSSRHSER